MTQREFFNVIANGTGTISFKAESGNTNFKDITKDDPEIVEFAKEQIEKLNARNAARKNKETPAAKAKEEENEALRQRIIEVTEVGVNYTAKAIAEVLGDDVKFQKVASVIKPLVENGTFVKGETKIKGKGKVNCYTKQ